MQYSSVRRFTPEFQMLSPTTLEAAFDRVTDYWSPKVIGQVNNQLLKAAKLKGELVWHAHDEEDELFYIVKGSLRIEFEDGPIDLEKGDFMTVPKGVRHNPVAREECWVLLIEPASTKHTGDEMTSRTRSLEDQLS
jgi:mannose-6-phosphate isomerase-like protein (cupin superfamily)